MPRACAQVTLFTTEPTWPGMYLSSQDRQCTRMLSRTPTSTLPNWAIIRPQSTPERTTANANSTTAPTTHASGRRSTSARASQFRARVRVNSTPTTATTTAVSTHRKARRLPGVRTWSPRNVETTKDIEGLLRRCGHQRVPVGIADGDQADDTFVGCQAQRVGHLHLQRLEVGPVDD